MRPYCCIPRCAAAEGKGACFDLIGDKKIIGVCLTKVQDDFRKDYLTYLYMNTVGSGYKLVVFNSLLDLYNGDVYDEGSKAVFDIINYDVFDAIVILCEGFYDTAKIDTIVERSKAHGIPVILVHGEREGCYCIQKEYTEAYKHIVRHVIKDHGATDIFFIGGRKTEDPSTELRLRCCSEVMAEFGLKLDDAMIDYGEYWEIPPKLIIDRLLRENGCLPRAIICANDSMAVAACEQIMVHGYKIPDDVIVTGFDGLVSAEYFIPRLTTCKEDLPKLASVTVDIINKAISREYEPGIFFDEYYPYVSESCGCGDDSSINYRERERYLYRMLQDIQGHEFHIYQWVDRVLESENINALSSALKDYVLPNSSVCLRDDFIMTAMVRQDKRKDLLSEELFVISSRNLDYTSGKQGKFPISEMIPDLKKWLEDETMCVITSIFVEDEVCGYYAVKTDNIASIGHKLNRLSKIMNVAFSALLNRMAKKRLQLGMQNAAYIDSDTGLPNLKGLTKWFDEFSAVRDNRAKTLAVSIYSIPQYKYIYETYGIQDIEEAVLFVAESLKLANSSNGYVARTGDDEFIIVNYTDDPADIGGIIDNAVSIFFGVIEGYDNSSDKEYFIEVNCGCTVVNPGWSNTLRSFIKLADAEMYVNRLKAGAGGSAVVKEEKKQSEKSPRDRYKEFNTLLEKNLFTYFFQPIVDAKTGLIYAYEALMRTTGGISMNPLEILDIAKEYGKLYQIEKATMFNVMERFKNDRDSFGGAKVFVNTIPGCFLHGADLERFGQLYRDLIGSMVIEITEQDTVSDDELDAMKLIGVNPQSGAQIAIDDYGTGHSNIVNLLRYEPQILKIDRFLISNIQNDLNKQMFVKSTIDFSKMNGIKVLAEGVETHEELMTVIDFGVDLIQGYYTARPAPDPIGEIPKNIRDEIVNENICLARYDNDMLVYRAGDGETVNLYDLSLNKYVSVRVGNGIVRLTGDREHTIDMIIDIEDGAVCVITLDDINIRSTERPTINLGEGSIVELILSGNSSLHKEGIAVPEGASLHITGNGNLSVFATKNGAPGIGGNYEERYGDITLEGTGEICVEASGDRALGIGGGSTDEASVKILGGRLKVNSTGINVLGIGSVGGRAAVIISEHADVTVKSVGRTAVGIGTVNGSMSVMSSGRVDSTADGEQVASIGTTEGSGTVTFAGGENRATVHGDSAVCIGTLTGSADIRCDGGYVRAYGEGESACGIGSLRSSATTDITGGTVYVRLLSGHAAQFGSDESRVIITGGNILADKTDDVNAVNRFGDKLRCVEINDSRSFERTIAASGGEYVYSACMRDEDEKLRVYIP